MPVDSQVRSVGADTANGVVDIPSLGEAIQLNSNIVTSMVNGFSIDVEGDVLTIRFKDTLSPSEIVALDATILAHDGQQSIEDSPVQAVSLAGVNIIDGRVDTSTFPSHATRHNVFTHDFTDPTTWYTNSMKIENHQLSNVAEMGTRFYDVDFAALGITRDELHIIDVSHAKIFFEDSLRAPDGGGYGPWLTVDGVVQKEKNLNNPDNWDYKLDYTSGPSVIDDSTHLAGRIEFQEPPNPGAVVMMTFYRATTSEFFVRPLPGKILGLSTVEIQFSTNVSVKDSMVFQPYGRLDGLTPEQQAQMIGYLQLIGSVPPGVTPPGDTIVPYGKTTTYKSMRDFIREANGNYPPIPASQAPKEQLTERDLRYDCVTYPWNYQSLIRLMSSKGMYVQISLKDHRPFSGEFGDATFYCFVEEDPNYQP